MDNILYTLLGKDENKMGGGVESIWRVVRGSIGSEKRASVSHV